MSMIKIPGPLICDCPRTYEVRGRPLALCEWILKCLAASVVVKSIVDQLRVTGWKTEEICKWLTEAQRLRYTNPAD